MVDRVPGEPAEGITLIHDYRGTFYSSTRNASQLCSMDIPALVQAFGSHGITLEVISYRDVDFRRDWSNRVVLYQSSEDPGLRYRSYIEDVILGLHLLGADLVPSYPLLRAHHNKSFFEILRKIVGKGSIDDIESRSFGTYEEFSEAGIEFPAVIKASQGAGSSGVRLLPSAGEAGGIIRKMAFSGASSDSLKEICKRMISSGRKPYSIFRNKFVIQEYIPGLDHDYKLLIYGSRAFLLRRGVRDNDFRASGSGRFQWPETAPDGLLDFGLKVMRIFDVAHVSMDIAIKDGHCFLIEAQFLQFGPLTMEKAPHHWIREGDQWVQSFEHPGLETVFADGVVEFTRNRTGRRMP